MAVRRVFIEKKEPFAVEAKALLHDLRESLGLRHLSGLRLFQRYDIERVDEVLFERALERIFQEAPVDDTYRESLPESTEGKDIFAVEYLPGQYDQRADSAEQCIRLLEPEADPLVRCAKVYCLSGELSPEELASVKAYVINTVDSREAGLNKPLSLEQEYAPASKVEILTGFTSLSENELAAFLKQRGLAMSLADLEHLQKYFKEEEKRDPSITEVKVLDTYWSDHCRHTTFATVLTEVDFEEDACTKPAKTAYERYLKGRESLGRTDKDICLMDIALMGMREIKAAGGLEDLEKSDEINACSIVIPVDVDGETEEWLLMFKNETHNHPTEIEPFGGAATCLGGAIRDPLSGRSYVYQAMRLTGAADPTVPLSETLSGKLPQRKIVREAAKGYSSYGNQIGLATGYVKEIYHPGYAAKHMELGAVIAAAPVKNVRREHAEPGDVIILLGGRTGRDGMGGATGSSKIHTEASIEECGAEVQKGNAPTERKLQRLFRNPEASRLIKTCNDFGAGGVCVAIGELAPGLLVDLDLVPKKYAGLDGTELAISESQERMAVVVDAADTEAFLRLAEEENLEATKVAEVTKEARLRLLWQGEAVVDLARSFIDTNGARSHAKALVTKPGEKRPLMVSEAALQMAKEQGLQAGTERVLGDIQVASQRGLVEMFDSTIGASSLMLPFGGAYQKTPTQVMAAKIPVGEHETRTMSLMSYGYDPFLTSWSPFHGAQAAVMESVAKIVSAGGDYRKIRFSFQEFFQRMTEDPAGWGQPLSALLGGYDAQMRLGLPSIGGKDSMSGSFNELHVPPTLVSIAVESARLEHLITPEFKTPGDEIVWVKIPVLEDGTLSIEQAMRAYETVHEAVKKGRVKASYALGTGGIVEAVCKMSFGNQLGAELELSKEELFGAVSYGSLLLETEPGAAWSEDPAEDSAFRVIGRVMKEPVLSAAGETISLKEVEEVYEGTLEGVYRTKAEEAEAGNAPLFEAPVRHVYTGSSLHARPRVFIPVFPGTNCEYDTARAFAFAGAEPDVFVMKNLTPRHINESVEEMVKRLGKAQILMLSGGFSAGDEPEGSGKFIATVFANEAIREATMELLQKRDGLALGICNGFQALIKLGLVPGGDIVPLQADAPTLTYNSVGRHVSSMVMTRVTSNLSPWLMLNEVGEVHTIAVSHGEGRFVAPRQVLQSLAENGQIATQYVDESAQPSGKIPYNPNGSMWAVEGITSPDGRVLGKMGHSERFTSGTFQNITGEKDQRLFESGVQYFLA